jgi:hypothetical protein
VDFDFGRAEVKMNDNNNRVLPVERGQSRREANKGGVAMFLKV